MSAHQPEQKEASFIMHNSSNSHLVTTVARMYHEQQQTQHEIAENLNLPQVGAVGNICLRFYNANGHQIEDSIHGRVLGLDLERLKKIPTVVGVACGKRKHQAILAALRGALENILVIDQFTAESLATG